MSPDVVALNADKLTARFDQTALQSAIDAQGEAFRAAITAAHAHLFAAAPLFVSAVQLVQMQAVISAVERIVKLAGWQDAVCRDALESGRCLGVFYGYDFHLDAAGAHLIEINTNAGGALLNALLIRSQSGLELPGKAAAVENPEQAFLQMFLNEWRLERGDALLATVCIVDQQPEAQYLYPEFLLAQAMFERAGIRAVIADPAQLHLQEDGLYLHHDRLDLVYNRLTDFALQQYPALRQAYRQRKVVLTPAPMHYSCYADKRNLALFSDAGGLRAIGASEQDIQVLQQGIPHTQLVAGDRQQWWESRRNWFFKPAEGYGSKAAYRGDKLTKRVFDEIARGNYVAQKLVAPGERAVAGAAEQVLKYDVRCYVYDGQVQLVAARLYQGQTTNFRTPAGGFAQVRVV